MPYKKQPTGNYAALSAWDSDYRQFSVSFPSLNQWGFPEIDPYTGPLPKYLVAYNAFNRSKVTPHTGIHFYITDNKFEAVWTHPARGLTRLKRAPIVLGPDFSMHLDWPRTVQMFNWYRSTWCMALWQSEGIPVIPTVCWADPSSYVWCFEGLPVGATVAVSSVGTRRTAEGRECFLDGFRAVYERLEPRRIVFYGTVPKELSDVAGIRAFSTKWQTLNKELDIT